MKKPPAICWIPRILIILFIIFISLFALDVFGEYQGLELLVALFIHLLPAIVLIILLIVSWKYELVGGILLILIAIFALFFFNAKENPAAIPILILPVLIIAVLFLISHYSKK